MTSPPVVEPYGPVVTMPLVWAHHATRAAHYRAIELLITCGWCGAAPGQRCTVAGSTRRAIGTHASRYHQVWDLLDTVEPEWRTVMLGMHTSWAEQHGG